MPTTSDGPPPADLGGFEVLVCVCGGIAAYKVGYVVSELVQRGAGVTVAMTRAARRFVGPLTFQSLSGRAVLTNIWNSPEPTDTQHIRATSRANLIIVAPATANTIARLANGFADEIVSTLVLSAASPVLLAPAMNDRMWSNPMVQANVTKLHEHNFRFVGPCSGWLACRSVGEGRMAEPHAIVSDAVSMLTEQRKSAKVPTECDRRA